MRALLIFITFTLFACEINEEPAKIDFSLLHQFDWRKIEQHTEKLPMDTSQLISYYDTTLYSFAHNFFILKAQYTIISITFGDGIPEHTLQQISAITEGEYKINEHDSLIQLTYTEKVEGNPAWGIPPRNEKKESKWKVLGLNRDVLKIKLESNSEYNSLPTPIETYSAVLK